MAFYKTHIEKATSTNTHEPAVIISKTDVLSNLSYLPSTNEQQQNPYALNEIQTNTNRDSGVIFPFRVEVDGKTYSYGTKNTCWSPNGFGYSNSTKWVNKKEVMNEFNTDHFWQEVYPGFYNWKTKVWENDEGTAGGASINADVNIPIWPVLKDDDSGSYSAAKEISTTNVFGVKSNEDTGGYGTEAVVTRYTTTGNVHVGFGAIISGDGLDDYVTKMTTPYSTNHIPRVCRLFTIRIKGGWENESCYASFNSTNCILKHYSFDKSITAADIDYKKLRNNVYYIHDAKITTLKFENRHGMFYITRKAPYSNTLMYYYGSKYPDGSGAGWVSDLSEATTWATYNGADEVYQANVMPGRLPRYDYQIAGGYTIHMGQPVFYNRITECSFMPQNSNFYFLTAASSDNVTRYYTGNPTTYTNSWRTSYSLEECTVFNSNAECNTFNDNLPTEIKNISHGFPSNGTYLSAGYNYSDGRGKMFSNMPAVRTLALNYYFD